MAIFQYYVCQGKDVSQSQAGKSKLCLICVRLKFLMSLWRSVPPFSGTLLPWAATYLTCVDCKCKSWCISQWRTLSSRKGEMRWNNNRNFSYHLGSAGPMKQLKWCYWIDSFYTRNEFRRLLCLWKRFKTINLNILINGFAEALVHEMTTVLKWIRTLHLEEVSGLSQWTY